jgi:HEAT repeat protein
VSRWGAEDAVPVLRVGLTDESTLVRAHAAWGLGRVGSPMAFAALSERVDEELDSTVLDDIGRALNMSVQGEGPSAPA